MKRTYKKSQGYVWGDIIGCHDEGELYKGIVCFMGFGLKELILYVIKSSPETNIDANWLETEFLDSLKILSNCGFRDRAIVCDNCLLNVSSFKKLWNMSTRIWTNYICYTSPEKSTFATTLSI